jgi:hypothetical protein
MRRTEEATIIEPMPADSVDQPVRLVLAVDRAADPPTGHLVDERGSVTAFSGWLQLMDTVDGARRRSNTSEVPDRSQTETETQR